MWRSSHAAVLALALAAAPAQAQAQVATAPSLERAAQDFARGDLDAAYPELVALAARPGAEAQVFLYKGLIERARGDLTRALASLRVAVERAPDFLPARLELAVTCSWDGRLEQALALYDGVLRRDPANRAALLGRARVLSWLGEHARSRAAYEAILERTPGDVEAMQGLADDARDAMDTPRAQLLYQQILVRSPADKSARDGLTAITLVTRAQIDAAIGTTSTDGVTWHPAGSLGLLYHLTPDVAATAAFRAEGAQSLGAGSGPSPGGSPAWLYVSEAGVKLRYDRRVDLLAGMRVSVAPTLAWSGPYAEAYGHVAKPLVVITSVHPTLTTHGVFGDLAGLGLQWLFPTDGTWALAQVFRYDDTSGTHALALVGTGNLSIHDVVEVKGGAGYTWHTAGRETLLLAEVSARTSRTTRVCVHYEHFEGFLDKQLLTGGGRVEF
jgi:tetratricopeptide (TPR) repeat protein